MTTAKKRLPDDECASCGEDVEPCAEANDKDVAMTLVGRATGKCSLTGNQGFTATPNYGNPNEEPWCFCGALLENTLYRLRDLEDTDEENRRIACDLDDRRRVGAEQWERSRRVLRGAR